MQKNVEKREAKMQFSLISQHILSPTLRNIRHLSSCPYPNRIILTAHTHIKVDISAYILDTSLS